MRKYNRIIYYSDSESEHSKNDKKIENIKNNEQPEIDEDIVSISSTEEESNANLLLTPRSLEIINGLKYFKGFFSKRGETKTKKPKLVKRKAQPNGPAFKIPPKISRKNDLNQNQMKTYTESIQENIIVADDLDLITDEIPNNNKNVSKIPNFNSENNKVIGSQYIDNNNSIDFYRNQPKSQKNDTRSPGQSSEVSSSEINLLQLKQRYAGSQKKQTDRKNGPNPNDVIPADVISHSSSNDIIPLSPNNEVQNQSKTQKNDTLSPGKASEVSSSEIILSHLKQRCTASQNTQIDRKYRLNPNNVIPVDVISQSSSNDIIPLSPNNQAKTQNIDALSPGKASDVSSSEIILSHLKQRYVTTDRTNGANLNDVIAINNQVHAIVSNDKKKKQNKMLSLGAKKKIQTNNTEPLQKLVDRNKTDCNKDNAIPLVAIPCSSRQFLLSCQDNATATAPMLNGSIPTNNSIRKNNILSLNCNGKSKTDDINTKDSPTKRNFTPKTIRVKAVSDINKSVLLSNNQINVNNGNECEKLIKQNKILSLAKTPIEIFDNTDNLSGHLTFNQVNPCSRSHIQNVDSIRLDENSIHTSLKKSMTLNSIAQIKLTDQNKAQNIELLPRRSSIINDRINNNVSLISTEANIIVPVTSSKRKKATQTANKLPKTVIKKRGVCPPYKIVEDTQFAVDAFRYGDIEGVSTYFLTHYHADHYIGLTKKFNRPIYMSEITGKLVETFIKVETQFIHKIQIHTSYFVEGIEIIALDANHCPGAVMFLFKLPSGECILHTGDFRADPVMEEYPELWNNQIKTLYLDTTYLSNKYDFQSQSDSLDQAKLECEKFLNKNIGAKYLIVCGSYLIGKEKVWMAIAQGYNLKVWLEPTRRKAVDCYGSKLIEKYLVNDPRDAQIHVLPLGNMQYPYLATYLDNFGDTFTNLLAIRPSGWEKNSKPSYGRRISIVGIEYSEHSSFSELRRFVRFVQPKNVISTVPSNKNMSRTSAVPLNWLNSDVKPFRKGYQTVMTTYAQLIDSSSSRIENINTPSIQNTNTTSI